MPHQHTLFVGHLPKRGITMLKFAFLQFKRQKVRSVIYFLVFFLSLAGLMGIYVLLTSAQESEATVLESIGASVTLDYGESTSGEAPVFTADVLDQLANQEHVLGYNQNYSDYALPKNFSNCRKYEGNDPATQATFLDLEPETSDYIVLEGDSNIQLLDLFRQGNAWLTDGSFPSIANPGAIISTYLADANALHIGDKLNITSCDRTHEITISITGIYQTKEAFVITDENIVGEAVFAYSPYNRIYADLDTTTGFFAINPETLYTTFYIDDPRNVSDTGEAMKTTDIDWSQYSLVNTTQNTYNMEAAQIEATISMAKTMLFFVLIISAATIILVTSIWGEQSRFESGIFLALGASKCYVLIQQFITTFLVAIPAYILSLICAKPLAGVLLQVKERISIQDTGTHSQFLTGLEHSSNVMLSSLNGASIVLCALFTFFVGMAACFIPMWCIFRLKPKEILSQR